MKLKLIFINSKNLRIRKLIARENFQDYSTYKNLLGDGASCVVCILVLTQTALTVTR